MHTLRLSGPVCLHSGIDVIADLVQRPSQAPTLTLLDSSGSDPIYFQVQMYATQKIGLGQQKPHAQQNNTFICSILRSVSVMKSSGLFLALLQTQLAQIAECASQHVEHKHSRDGERLRH